MSIKLTSSGVTFSDSTSTNFDAPKFLVRDSSISNQTTVSIQNIPDSASIIFLHLNLIMSTSPGQLYLALGPSGSSYISRTTSISSGTAISSESFVGSLSYIPLTSGGTPSVNNDWYFNIQLSRTTTMSNSVQVVGSGGTYTQGTATTPRTTWFAGSASCRPMTEIIITNSVGGGMYGTYTVSYT